MKAFVLAVAGLCVMGASASAQEGRYRVAGKNPNGSGYTGVAEIAITSRNTCRIRWDVGSVSTGICMRRGNTFSAAYVLGEKAGLVIYELKQDGSLEGIWTVADQPGVGAEPIHQILFRRRRLEQRKVEVVDSLRADHRVVPLAQAVAVLVDGDVEVLAGLARNDGHVVAERGQVVAQLAIHPAESLGGA